jgi:hypothetical protein
VSVRLRRLVSLLTLVTLIGCHAHVQLEAPSAGAPLPQRQAAYADLRPLSSHGTITFRGAAHVSTTTDYLQLAGGQRVYHAEDLLAVVPAGSPTATAAEASASSRSLATILRTVGVVTMLAGSGISLAGVADTDDQTLLYAGIGVLGLGLLVFLLGGVPAGTANDEKNTAFQTYDAALRERLDLCGDGEGADCP